MSQDELRNLTERLAVRQAAQAERLTHQRRGGPRQPGARGGIFPQKISNSERVLLTVLYLRKLCTLDVLADALGDVSRSAVAGVVPRDPTAAGTRRLASAPGVRPLPRRRRTSRHSIHIEPSGGRHTDALIFYAAEIWNAEDKRHALDAAKAFQAAYGAKFAKATAKITHDLDQLLAFFDFPAEHWIHLRITNPI
jgi:Transposase, Mutator family